MRCHPWIEFLYSGRLPCLSVLSWWRWLPIALPAWNAKAVEELSAADRVADEVAYLLGALLRPSPPGRGLPYGLRKNRRSLTTDRDLGSLALRSPAEHVLSDDSGRFARGAVGLAPSRGGLLAGRAHGYPLVDRRTTALQVFLERGA